MIKTVKFVTDTSIDTMNIQTELKWLHSELDKVQDPDFIKALKSMFTYRSKQKPTDWWDTISEEEKAEIEEGAKEIERGEFISHEEVMANPRKWA